MDTTNNQDQNIQQPQNQAGNMEQQLTQYQNPDLLKGKSGRTIIILVVSLIIVIAIGAYLILINSMGNKTQNTPATNISPSPTSVPATPTPTEEFYLEDPEIDLKVLDESASSL